MSLSASERIARLTPQQRRVALLLGQGLTYTMIADHLSLSPHTIHEHIRHIYERLGCCRRELVVLLLAQVGLLK